MSLETNLIESAIALVEKYPNSLSLEEIESLEQRVINPTNDLSVMAKALADWFQSRPHLYAALTALTREDRQQGSDRAMASIGLIRLPGEGTSAPPIKAEDYQKTLLNAIHRSKGQDAKPQADAS